MEAEALYDVLERDVIPSFYDRGPDRLPRKWIDRMKASIESLCHFVNTHRMVSDYVKQLYLPARDQFCALDENGAQRARSLAAALERIHRMGQVRIEPLPQRGGATLPIGARLHVEAALPGPADTRGCRGRVVRGARRMQRERS
jgi:glycogen phosphorylase